MGATLGLKLVKLWKNSFCPPRSEDIGETIDDDVPAAAATTEAEVETDTVDNEEAVDVSSEMERLAG